MRIRLRDKYSDSELGRVYAAPHSHQEWYDHRVRVDATIALVKNLEGFKTVADLSAGDATIINALDIPVKYVGDFAPGYEFTGPIEKTIHQIPKVDLFICSETLEHLDNPDLVLSDIRNKTDWLVLTTPNGEADTNNPQHYWGWNTKDMQDMLFVAGFEPHILNVLNFFDKEFIYNYQMWVCK